MLHEGMKKEAKKRVKETRNDLLEEYRVIIGVEIGAAQYPHPAEASIIQSESLYYVDLEQCGKWEIGSVMHGSWILALSAAIYLSRIDASPEVNGRVVTISPWTLGLIL
ncbi:hypothetical protein KQX54_005862 [Cotesia glomerata]|uniref:Uncharacterized protein n=1 Tax=Cotesia glomerata TaxID=32391 RepID=A0AAV7HV41_COTGL|nr:hypothetical protein KQX54_005862 [Cotesia glomerata]